MKLSFDWLSEYVDLSGVSPQEVAQKLTMGAFEVEEVRRFGANLSGPVVVGQILEISPHPDPKATKIRLTKTRVAIDAEPLDIVCGAQNIQVGQSVPVALPGACVINRKNGEPLPIIASEIRGARSNGMLCSPPELGLAGGESEGILIFSEPYEIGSDVLQLLNLKSDWVLHVEPRSNRGDALSVRGLAREVAALLQRPLIEPKWSLDSAQLLVNNHAESVHIECDECDFFSIRIIAGLALNETPDYIKRRLEAVGARCINSIVDITNYVMHELGQPLHAYDLTKVAGSCFKVRRAVPGERLTTLDSKDRELTPEMLVIADATKPIGVAGVMGGLDSEVTESSTIIALEAASFAPARVRRGSRLLGLSSESSLRFERGVDLAAVKQASDRATYLLLKHCSKPEASIGQFTSAGSDAVSPVHINVRTREIRKILAEDFSLEQVKQLLTPLGFKVTAMTQAAETKHALAAEGDHSGQPRGAGVMVATQNPATAGGLLAVDVPSFRQRDVTREIDVIEEICRIWGYDRVPVSMPTTNVPPDIPDSSLRVAQDTLVGLGLSEAWISSLTGGDDAGLGFFDESRAVRVLNPLSSEHQVLRQSLLPGLIRAAQYNYDRGTQDIWLFEVGRVYLRDTETNGKQSQNGTGVVEHQHVAAILMGTNNLSAWYNQTTETAATYVADFYSCKGVVEHLLTRFHLNACNVRFVTSTNAPACLHPSRSGQILIEQRSKDTKTSSEEPLGWIGELHPALRDQLGLRQSAYVFELSIDTLRKFLTASSFKEVSGTPAVVRDITVDLPESVEHSSVHSCITSAAGSVLRKLELTKVYDLEPGQTKSLTFRMQFQSAEKTLTNEEVEVTLSKIRKALVHRLSAAFRT